MRRLEFNLKKLYDTLKKYRYLFLFLLFLSFLYLTREKTGTQFMKSFFEKEKTVSPFEKAGSDEGTESKKLVVVLDAGHGGNDPGKVGANGTREKDVNLAVVKQLEEKLLQEGFTVVLTRTEDRGLYSDSSQNKKKDDMKERVRIIEEAAPDLAVSIHQNSYPSESCVGAQVFYYEGSEKSSRLAGKIQDSFLEVLQDGNKRKEKANSSYYLLKKVTCPIVIAECGFLSSSKEEALLITEEYQERVAEAVYLGILRYAREESGEDTRISLFTQ